MKNVLKYTLALISLCASFLQPRLVRAEPNLFLSSLLGEIDKKLEHEANDVAADLCGTLKVFRGIVAEAQVEYDAILQEFSAGCYMLPGNVNLMRMRFCAIFNNFSLSMQGLRKFRQALATYEYEITKYPYSITKRERELFVRILMFNVRYIAMLLDAELFDFSFIEKTTDFLVTQPVEWVHAHKRITIILGCIVLGGITYYVVNNSHFPKKHITKYATILQPHVLQQTGSMCGYHAVYNAQCLLRANGDEKEAARLMNDATAFELFCNTIPETIQKDNRGDKNSSVYFRDPKTNKLLQNIDIAQIEVLAELKGVSTVENYFYIHQVDAYSSLESRDAARHDYVAAAEEEIIQAGGASTVEENSQRLLTARAAELPSFRAIVYGTQNPNNRVVCVVNTACNLGISPAIREQQLAAEARAQAALIASREENPPTNDEILAARRAACSAIKIPPPAPFHYIALEAAEHGKQFVVVDSMNWDQTRNPLFDNLYELFNNK